MSAVRTGRALGTFLGLLVVARAGTAQADTGYAPHVEDASDEGRAAMEGFEVADGFEVELFAAEPHLANPVCLTIDEDGRVFVGETFRHHAGVTDIREHMDWLDDDLACRTVGDRIAMLRKHLGEDFATFETEHERVRLLIDADDDGVVDDGVVYADGFDAPEAGIGAGLLAHRGDVYYTCIPDLWRLRDTDGDGRADEREVLSTGYGVRVAYLGHDLHGLRIGMDGRLYFSIGDRGLHVVTEDGTLAYPGTGVVLRCELDGSRLEVVHTGLRNPQELAFDDFGNLFTADNNADSGDEARWVHIVEGGDSGWRQPYQWLDNRGPWNEDLLWEPHFDGQASYIVPPVANVSVGPSGLTSDPGTGLPPSLAGRFFLCDFFGAARHSGVLSIEVLPKGASFELGEVDQHIWGVLATDAEFGPDGALYVTDWVEGWNTTGKGRVYRVFDPEWDGSDAARRTARDIASDVKHLAPVQLAGLLRHADRRVRLAAQLELTRCGYDGIDRFREAIHGDHRLARLHGLWGLGIMTRGEWSPEYLVPYYPLLATDPDAEVRAQLLNAVGEARWEPAGPFLALGLRDTSPRVRYFAALGVAKLGVPEAVEPLVDLVRDAADRDTDLRHAAVIGLTGCADAATIARLADDESVHVRRAALLVQRRCADPAITRFLRDDEVDLVVDAARAIHDVPIPQVMEALAGMDLHRPELVDEPALVRRVLNACHRLGGDRHARRLAELAARDDLADEHRVDALEMLVEWAEPSPRDRVVGRWSPLAPRSAAILAPVARELAAADLTDADDALAAEWARLVAAAGAVDLAPRLRVMLEDESRDAAPRVESLLALESLAAPELPSLVDGALSSADVELRAAALEALDRLDPREALPRLPAILETGEMLEQRVALSILATVEDPVADDLVASELERLASDLVPAELALDVLLAGEERGGPRLTPLLDRHRERRAVDAELGPYLDGLFGGDAERGREVYERPELSCVRCHATADDDAPRVGPALDGVGTRLARLQILESIVAPNRRTTPGFGSTLLFLADGDAVSGRILDEDETTVRLQNSDGDVLELAVADVDERRPSLSAMPEGLSAGLTRRELRDLVEYVSGL